MFRATCAGLFAVVVLLSAMPGEADSIRVDGKVYQDVTIVESATRYYFRDAGEDRVVSVSKGLVNPADIQFSDGRVPQAAADTMAEEPPRVTPMPPTEPGARAHFDSDDLGIALDYPGNWFLLNNWEESGLTPSIVIASRKEGLEKLRQFTFDADAEPGTESEKYDPKGASFSVANLGAIYQGMTPLEFLSSPGFMDQFRKTLYDPEVVQAPTATSISGQDAAIAVIRGENRNGIALTVTVIQLVAGENQAVITYHYPTKDEGEFAATLRVIANGVEIRTRKLDESGPDVSQGETATP